MAPVRGARSLAGNGGEFKAIFGSCSHRARQADAGLP
jgi:hypothetical protein